MTHGSLFSGVGGFDLAAEWMGWENVFHCEWNEFGQKVLNHYWPKAELFKDITKSDFTKYHGSIDIISGGFPCQPYSAAGKRKGKEDDRHLWPQMLRTIREVSPRWVVGENVRGLTNWNGGMVFDEVQADLESEGYEVLPFLLPACAVNAPHRRDRVWFVAYSNGNGNRNIERQDREAHSLQKFDRAAIYAGQPTGADTNVTYSTGSRWRQSDKEMAGRPSEQFNGARIQNVAHSYRQRQQQQPGNTFATEPGQLGRISFAKRDWTNWPTESPLCSRNDGISSRLSGITFSKHRNESIKAYGNAVVPQIVYEIFKAIEKYENARTT